MATPHIPFEHLDTNPSENFSHLLFHLNIRVREFSIREIPPGGESVRYYGGLCSTQGEQHTEIHSIHLVLKYYWGGEAIREEKV